ncbi:MAG TPA: endonuclease NucS [Candidatus Nanoarchaeia archaeon]|nr:endonuclease NucS [Candidatus Nanoarchaeia archaeon]
MELIDFKEKFQDAIIRNESIVFFCNCEIRYSGRAEAFLAPGDRMVIVKADNALIVHQPEGGNPINYMKPNSKIVLENFENHLLLKAQNLETKDYLDLEIFRVHSFMSHKLEDGIKQELAGNEKDMSDMLKNHPELISKDFKPLSREEHTKFGFIDVFGHDKQGNLVVVECKRYTASLQCVTQLRRYVEKISELKGIELKRVKGILASPTISPNALDMLKKWGFEWKQVNPPKRLERYNRDQRTLPAF